MDKFDLYIAKLTEPNQKELGRLIDIVRREVPEAEQSISYGLPAFKYKNKPLIYFGAFKDHISIFPTSGPILELADKLSQYTTGKGTLQYTLDKPFPEELIKEIVVARVKQINS